MIGFKNRTSKFGSLVSLLALSALLMLFAVNFPVFMGSATGQVFASIWAGVAVVMVVTHVVRLMAERQPQKLIMLPGKKDARTRKNIQKVRARS